MSNSDNTNTPDWLKLSPDLEHFDPFEGVVDLHADQNRDIRYGFIMCYINLVFEQTLICEVVQHSKVYPIPNTPNWVKGLINLRGNLIPVFNLYDYWKIEDRSSKLPLLVLGAGNDAFGLYADSFPQALEINNETPEHQLIPDTIPVELRTFVTHSYELNNSVWHATDIVKFIQYLTRDYSDINSESGQQ